MVEDFTSRKFLAQVEEVRAKLRFVSTKEVSLKELVKWFRDLPNSLKGLIAGSIVVDLVFYALFAVLAVAALSQVQKIEKPERAAISPRKLPSVEKLVPPKGEVKDASSKKEKVRVARVIDGDTIEVEGGKKVRYIGIDCPEKGKPFSDEASAANRELVEGRVVTLVKDVSEKDVFGRLLRYVYVGEVFVNAKLIKEGLAEATPYPPDVAHEDEFKELEREAKNLSKGMWTGQVQPIQPQGQSSSQQQTQGSFSSSQQGLIMVYVNEPGVEYHQSGCSKLDSNSKLVSLDLAKSRGYAPCTSCSPPQ